MAHYLVASYEPKSQQPDGFNIRDEGEHRNTSSKYASLLSTLMPLLIVSVPLFVTFIFLRVKIRRIYAPRTFLDVLHDEEKTPKLEKIGYFNWMPEFWRRPDQELLDHQNLDGYLFIRYMKMSTLVSFVGVCLTLPLLVLNYTGGGKEEELDSLTISNIQDPTQYYWHCLIAIVFFGFVIYVVTRETVYYINLRYAFLLTPREASLLSSRTVLFTSVPSDWQDEEWIRAEFDQVERVWIASNTSKLESLVAQRDDVAFALEGAEVQMLNKALQNKSSGRVQQHQRSGLPAARYVQQHDRPKSRSYPLMGSKQDAIEVSRAKLQRLIPQIEQQQKQHVSGRAEKLPAAFVQFRTQRAAQAAFQSASHELPGSMESRAVGTSPDQLLFKNLGIGGWSRFVRTTGANTVIVLLILFWSIPVGLVTSLADIDVLTGKIPFLSFINNIPVPILGAITGLLPAVLVSGLLALIPIICRFLATLSGAVTLAQVELKTQAWYFAFQVIQLFLVTTFSSGASSVAQDIFEDPTKATSLLAENLPTASNFYLSYFMLQGLTVAASEIFQVVPLLFAVLGRFIDTTPRKRFDRWVTLSSIAWGDTYPKLTNLFVIALAYSCIAPLVLAFATVGFGILYLAYRYNIFYVMRVGVNTKGEAFGRALQHLVVGIYLAELSLIGIFAAGGGNEVSGIMIIFFVITLLYQAYINWVLSPLLNSLSDRILAEDEEEALSSANLEQGHDAHQAPELRVLINNNLGTISGSNQNFISAHRERGGIFARYLFNGPSSSYPELRAKLRSGWLGQSVAAIPNEDADGAYLHPAITSPTPTLWIPKDDLGVSAEQIMELRSVIRVSDESASFDEDGNIVWDRDDLKAIPIWKERIDL